MCGIFGISVNENTPLSPSELRSLLRDLQLLSESRGKEAAGLAVSSTDTIEVLKSAVSASKMVRTQAYGDLLNAFLLNGSSPKKASLNRPLTFVGHSRLVTTGSQYNPLNNQPVNTDWAVGVHNGIVVNHDDLWARYPTLQRRYEVDSEVILQLLRLFHEESGSLVDATRRTFAELKGAASIAVLFQDLDALLLATNNGSLYRLSATDGHTFLFASERYIIDCLLRQSSVRRLFPEPSIQHVVPGSACIVDTLEPSVVPFRLDESSPVDAHTSPSRFHRRIVEKNGVYENDKPLTVAQRQVGLRNKSDRDTAVYLDRIAERFPHETTWQDSLRRCTRCILPESMPFIAFDDEGVCNYCNYYRELTFFGADKLAEIAERYRRSGSEPDCVVGVSGGRDSLYSLHYIKNVLGMTPIAYTYDWGMVTDLARRNISRICGKLGIEHILVSADITKKRRFIRNNVRAWLRKPELGMIPLFMAGDKQYFYYLQQVRKQVQVDVTFLGENMLERTDFKTGFAGVAPSNLDPHHVYTLPLRSKIGLLSYYGWQYLRNLAYINTSLFDTLFAAACYYAIDRGYVNLYNYIPWEEDVVIPTLIREYEFELATDSDTTWRIGDGTAAFYNYIYYNVAGFTENDTFRSNQIREGLISREKALERVRIENRPRFETIYWYINIIQLEMDLEEVLARIASIPRLRGTWDGKEGN